MSIDSRSGMWVSASRSWGLAAVSAAGWRAFRLVSAAVSMMVGER